MFLRQPARARGHEWNATPGANHQLETPPHLLRRYPSFMPVALATGEP